MPAGTRSAIAMLTELFCPPPTSKPPPGAWCQDTFSNVASNLSFT